MENQELNVLNLKTEEGQLSKKKDNNVDLWGTGVKSLRVISTILIFIGIILCFVGLVQLSETSSYHPERGYIGVLCISSAISCFIMSPVFKVLATIGEAAKIYKDNNSK